jgi:hypothetical protein
MPARESNEDVVDVVGMVRRHAFLVEELTVDAVSVPHHVERPAPQVRQGVFCDVYVVGDEVALREAALGEDHPVGVGDRNVVTTDAHDTSILKHMLEGHPIANDVTLEPLDDYLVLEPVDESELPSGLIVPSQAWVYGRDRACGPDVAAIEPGECLLPRDAGYEVRLALSQVRVLKPRILSPEYD